MIAVADQGDLRRLLDTPNLRRRVRREGISLTLDVPDRGRRALLEVELNRIARDCGCHQGSMGSLLGLIIAVAWLATAGLTLDITSVARVVLVVGSLGFVGGLMGKALGLTLAERKLRNALNELLSNRVESG